MLEPTKNKILKFTKVGLVVAILGVTTLAVSYQGITKLEKLEQNKLQSTTISKEFKEISAGTSHSLAIDTSGNLWTWGNNSNGQLGNGSNTNSFQPVQIKSGTRFSKISAGDLFSLAIDTSGNLWGWGDNEYGKLANGTTTDSYIPVQIKSGTKFREIAVGVYHCLAIDTSNNLWAWGDNSRGHLGNGNGANSNTNSLPIQVKSGTKFSKVCTCAEASFAIDTSNNLWGWGMNMYGQLGNGTTTSSFTPIQIQSGTKFSEVSTGHGHTLAIDTSGNLWAWGHNDYGQLGNGGTGNAILGTSTEDILQTIPVIIKSGTKFTIVATGDTHSAAIDEDGNLWTWGRNNIGQLGNFTIRNSNVPVQITAYENEKRVGAKFTNIAAGTNHTLTIDTLNTLWSCGNNSNGQLGDECEGSYNNYYPFLIPVPRIDYPINYVLNGGTILQEYPTYRWRQPSQSLSTVTKQGYQFRGWCTDASLTSTPVWAITAIDEGTKTYYAKWTANTNTAYKVEHYKQNTSLNGYVIVTADTQNLKGTTDANVTATARTYGGFTLNTSKSIRSGRVAADGSLVLKLYYDRNTYNVTLNRNGGTISSGNNITSYTYGVEQTLPTLTKSGYTFGGWYTNSSFSGSSVTKISTTETGAKTYYAKWTANTNTPYKVEHYQQNKNKEGYTLCETETKTGATDTTVNATSKTYTGFTYNQNVNGTVRSGKVSADGSLVLKLYYDRNTYNVTLNRDGGTISSGSNITSYTYGVEVNLPTLTKTGYTFAGWYTNSSFLGSAVTKISATDTGAKEYYAKWTANTNTSYKVEYYKQNLAKNGYDKVEEDSKTLTGTTGASVTAEDKAYAGFSLNEASSVRTGTILGNGSLVLRMYYDRNTYHVTLNPGEGTLPEESKNINFTYGEEKPLPTPEKEGYDFTGWYDKDGNKVEKITPEDIGDKEYTARYEIKTYTVTFVSDGQTVGTQSVEHGKPVTAPSLTKPGYTLSWDKDLTRVTGNITATAIWTAKDGTAYKIEYYHQNLAKTGYELVQTETLTGKTGDTVTVVEGKAFRGFSENKTHPNRVATGVILGDGTFTLKLYYDRSTYKITLDPGEGTLPEDSKNIDYTYGEEKELPTPERPGYIFDGWYDDDGNKVDKIKPSDAGDKNYHASWVKEDEYYITSPKYEINKEENYIMRVSPNTAVTVFLSNIRTNGTPKVLNAKKEEVEQDSLVGTGYILQVDYKGTIYEYEIAVRGDLDGNGKVTVTDLSMLNQALVKRLELTGMRKIAGDIDYNKEVSVTDLSMMNQYFVKKIEL